MTKQMQVLGAVKALVVAALPDATVIGFTEDAAKPARVGSGGCVIGGAGDVSDEGTDLSPLTYNYAHRIPVDVIGPDGKGAADLDPLLDAIAAAAAADPTLGGLCQWFGVEGYDLGDRSTDGVASMNWATINLLAEYSANNALR